MESADSELSLKPGFYKFVREERLFCATLYHLLLQKGPNLRVFLNLVAEKLAAAKLVDPGYATAALDTAEIYVEFTYLRDWWQDMGKANERKRETICRLLSQVDTLRSIAEGLPADIRGFNARFMSSRRAAIIEDIAYPGQWSVAALDVNFGQQPSVFRDLCKFKWSFNIKPDLVIILPQVEPLCIKAKLESGEGQYPSSFGEQAIFDRLFPDVHERRVGQLDVQQFMFDHLLGCGCQLVFLGARTSDPKVPCLSWEEVLGKMDKDSSIPFVPLLVKENRPLQGRAARSDLSLSNNVD